MNREELRHDFHNEQGINWENSQGEPDIDYVMWLENKILAVRNNTPLPPAEGADPKKVQWSGYGELGNISQKPLQPTAEGAEEILLRQRNGEDKPITYAVSKDGWVYKMILRAMYEFATLHAQRIADKMVEEGLKEELIDFGHAMFPDESLQNIKHYVDTHLKSREP